MPKLGIDNGQLMQCPKTPNCVHSQPTDKKHYIPPLHFKGTQQEAQSLLLEIVRMKTCKDHSSKKLYSS